MKLIFGDPESIRIRDEYIKEWYQKNIDSEVVEQVCGQMEDTTLECDCYRKNDLRERFASFNANLLSVDESNGRLFWEIRCSLYYQCVFDFSPDFFQHPECCCATVLITDLKGSFIDEE